MDDSQHFTPIKLIKNVRNKQRTVILKALVNSGFEVTNNTTSSFEFPNNIIHL